MNQPILPQRLRTAEQLMNHFLSGDPAVRALERVGLAASETVSLAMSSAVPSDTPDEGALAGQSPLSARELEVLRLVARGSSNRGIAAELGVSEFTIKRHVQNILTKLDLPTRAAAASYAVRIGLA